MKGRALFVVSAFVAGAAAMPAFAAGTNEKNPDSYATGMTGTGSNATDPNANDSRAVVVPGTTYVAPASAASVSASAPVAGNIIAPAGTVAYATQPAATVVY